MKRLSFFFLYIYIFFYKSGTNTTNVKLFTTFFFFIKLCNCKIFKKEKCHTIIYMIYSFNFDE